MNINWVLLCDIPLNLRPLNESFHLLWTEKQREFYHKITWWLSRGTNTYAKYFSVNAGNIEYGGQL